MAKRSPLKTSLAIDFTSTFIDLDELSAAAGVKATHWYTPTSYAPKVFGWAFSNHEDGENYCWQYRRGFVFNERNIRERAEILADVLLPRTKQIRRACKKFSMAPTLYIVFEFADRQSSGFAVGARMLRFLAELSGNLVVTVDNAFDLIEQPPKPTATT